MPYAQINPQQMGAIGQFNPTGWQNYWQDPAALAMLSGVRMDQNGNPIISLNGQEVPWLNYANGSGIVDLGNNKGYYVEWNPTSSTNDGSFGGIPVNQFGNGYSTDNIRAARQIDDLNAWMSSGQDDWLDQFMTIAAPSLILGAGLFGGATNGFGNYLQDPFGLNGPSSLTGGGNPYNYMGPETPYGPMPGGGNLIDYNFMPPIDGYGPPASLAPPGVPGAPAAGPGGGSGSGSGGGNGGWGSLIGAGIGALGSYLGAANAPEKITQTVEPWDKQQPYLIDMFNRAQQAVNQSGQPTNLQRMAVGGAENVFGSPLFGQSEYNIGELMGSNPGDMFGVGMGNAYMGMDNPYLQQTIDATSQDVLRNMQGQFNTAQKQSGSYGNSGLQQMYAREVPKALGNIANQQRFGAYQQDAGLYENMLNRSMNQYNTAYNARNNAAFNAPAWGGQMMGVAGQAYGMGQQQAAQPFESLNQYKNIVGGTGYGQTASQPNYTNPWASALGGAMGGWQLGKLF